MSHDTLSQNPSEGLTRSGAPAVRFYTASLDSRTLTLAVHGKRPLPLLILNSEQQTESFYEALFKACHRKGAKAFNLLVISGFDCEQDEADWGLGSLEDCVFDSNVNQVDVGSGGNGASDAYNVLLFVK